MASRGPESLTPRPSVRDCRAPCVAPKARRGKLCFCLRSGLKTTLRCGTGSRTPRSVGLLPSLGGQWGLGLPSWQQNGVPWWQKSSSALSDRLRPQSSRPMMGHTDSRRIPPTLTPGRASLPRTRFQMTGPGWGPSLGPQPSAWPAHRGVQGGRSGGEHPREEKGTDMTLRPSSPAPDGPPAWPLHSRKGLHTRRSSERRQVPWLPLDPPAWAFPAPAGVPGCSRPGAPFPTGGRPGARWLCYSFPPSSPLVPVPGTVPWFLGSCPLHSFCLCSGKKAPLFPSASDSRAPRHGTVAEPVFI